MIGVFAIAFTSCKDSNPVSSVADDVKEAPKVQVIPDAGAGMAENGGTLNFGDYFPPEFTDVTDLITTIPEDALVGTRTVNFPNNADACAEWDIETDFSGKIDTGDAGTYTIPGTNIDVTLSHLPGGNFYAVSVEEGYVLTDIFLKHREDYNEWYKFYPWVTSASGMTTGQNALSHFSVCVNEAPQPLMVAKTAVGTYDRTVDWDLKKSVLPVSHTGMAGDDFQSTWTVEAIKSVDFGNYNVSGTITITNPNRHPLEVAVADELSDGTLAVVECPDEYIVPAKVDDEPGVLVCTYTAVPDDAEAENNTATVTPLNPYYEGDSDTEAIAWSENLIGFDSGTLSDPRFEGEPWEYDPEIISASTTRTFDETFVCSEDMEDYTDYSYSENFDNTAYLNDNIELDATARVTINCEAPRPLEVAKTAAGTYDRTVTWELDKTVSPESHSGIPGDMFSSTWTVTATKSETLGNYVASGTITITNPNVIAVDIEISDALGDGTVATVVCPVTGDNTGTVPAKDNGNDGELVCSYSASPADDAAEDNTATVTSLNPMVDGDYATVPLLWTENLIGVDEPTLSDPRFGFSNLISGTTMETFPEDFDCSEDMSLYTDGFYSYIVENYAYLNDVLNLSASATVTVECYAPEPESETAWAANGDVPGELRYNERGGNWATYVQYTGEKTVSMFAGQTIYVGTAHFSEPDGDDYVYITISLEGDWFFESGSIIAVQDYEFAPSGNPAPGRFDHKFDAVVDPITVKVPLNNFYGVHAVVASY